MLPSFGHACGVAGELRHADNFRSQVTWFSIKLCRKTTCVDLIDLDLDGINDRIRDVGKLGKAEGLGVSCRLRSSHNLAPQCASAEDRAVC